MHLGIWNQKRERIKKSIKDSWWCFNCTLKGNKLDINSIFEKDGSVKENIQKEAVYRINFCKDVTKLAIPKLIKKLPEGVELDEEKIDNLTKVFPLQYLSMFEQMRRRNNEH